MKKTLLNKGKRKFSPAKYFNIALGGNGSNGNGRIYSRNTFNSQVIGRLKREPLYGSLEYPK